MTVLLVFLAQTLHASAPLVLAAMAGVLAERAGVPMLALEGLLLAGAFGAALGALGAHSTVIGLLCAALAACALAGVFSLGAVALRANAVVTGVAVNLLALSGTRAMLKVLYGSASNSPPLPIDAGARGSALRAVLVNVLNKPTLWLAGLSVLLVHAGLSRTVLGVRITAAGEHPEALHAQGVSVARTRASAIVIGGALAGLGGAHLALSQHEFVTGMSGGRGYLALAAVILGRWRPGPSALAALGIGALSALEATLAATVKAPPQWVQALPFVVTLFAVVGLVGRTRAPGALGRAWE